MGELKLEMEHKTSWRKKKKNPHGDKITWTGP